MGREPGGMAKPLRGFRDDSSLVLHVLDDLSADGELSCRSLGFGIGTLIGVSVGESQQLAVTEAAHANLVFGSVGRHPHHRVRWHIVETGEEQFEGPGQRLFGATGHPRPSVYQVNTGLAVTVERAAGQSDRGGLEERPGLSTSYVVDEVGGTPRATAITWFRRSITTKAHPSRIASGCSSSTREASV